MKMPEPLTDEELKAAETWWDDADPLTLDRATVERLIYSIGSARSSLLEARGLLGELLHEIEGYGWRYYIAKNDKAASSGHLAARVDHFLASPPPPRGEGGAE